MSLCWPSQFFLIGKADDVLSVFFIFNDSLKKKLSLGFPTPKIIFINFYPKHLQNNLDTHINPLMH